MYSFLRNRILMPFNCFNVTLGDTLLESYFGNDKPFNTVMAEIEA